MGGFDGGVWVLGMGGVGLCVGGRPTDRGMRRARPLDRIDF